MTNCPVGKVASIFVSVIINTSKLCAAISLSTSNLFLTELIFRYPMMTLPMFLILSNFNADLASVARVSVVRVLAAEESTGMAEISVFKGSLSASCALSPD